MKTKLLFLVFLIAAVVISCQKKDSEPAQQDVVFSVVQVDEGLKSTNEIPDCDPTLEPVYALIKIDDGISIKEYTPAVFRLDGKLYTQAIKLPAGSYTVTEFLVMDDLGDGIDPIPTDKIYMAVPTNTSNYKDYVTTTVPFNVTVTAFTKVEIDIEVLCFLEKDYTNFGFFWFNITEIIIREQCFFGDICVDNPLAYTGSNYALQPSGLQIDMPAIMKIHIYKDGVEVPNSPFTNNVAPGYGVGDALCVQYPDNLNIDEEVFTVELWVLIEVGNGFNYYLFHTFTFEDEEMIPAGTDGVVDFVIGNCNLTPADFEFDWPQTYTMIVKSGDLATGFTDPELASKWFYYNDENDQIDNTLGGFVAGPGTPPAGSGSSQVTVSGSQRVNLATYQFYGTPLANITTMEFSTYNPSAGNGGSANNSGYFYFNVDFDGSDTWQRRLVFVPSDNGTVVQDSWQAWDVIMSGNALWRWSGNLWGGPWPDAVSPAGGLRTWSDIVASFPNARIRLTDSNLGIRVGEPYPNGYTENMDLFRFQAGGPMLQFDFEQ